MNNLVIIGAPRSGTNMLRDVLTTFDNVATWPCDEINYIWRHGNVRFPSDELTPELVTSAIATYIQRQFDWVRRNYAAHTVVEKTCANSLRVPFVDRVLPDAKYIFIVRDGLDAVGSAMKRWKAELDIPYILRKVRFVPIGDLPYYGGRYFWSRVYRLFSREKRLAFWGPRLEGMDTLLGRHQLDEICALQWERCVTLAESAFQEMDASRVCRVRYEDFVSNPAEELTSILNFCSITAETTKVRAAVANVSSASIGKGRRALAEKQAERLAGLVGETLDRYGY